MSFIVDRIRNRRHGKEDPKALKPKDFVNHHCFGGELLADGFISPIVLPKQRIQDLLGSDSVSDMARRCRLSEDDLQKLLDNDFLEPTSLQYYNIAHAYNVSVMWLMGYHTTKERQFGSYDQAMLNALMRRNSTENRLLSAQDKGIFAGTVRKFLEDRAWRQSMDVSNVAARITAKEHLPLSDEELYILEGQPVFLEYMNETTCWGIPNGDDIVTVAGRETIANNQQKYKAYLTPDTAAKFDDE